MSGGTFKSDDDQLKTPMSKPTDAIERLITLFTPTSQPLDTTATAGKIAMQDNQQNMLVILLIKGEIDIFRNVDNLLFANASGPCIFGMQGTAFRFDVYQFRASKDSELRVLTQKEALSLMIENNALNDLVIFQSYFSDYQAHRDNLLINKSTYEIICSFLYELERVPMPQRLKISVANYILERSNLARSGVMKILADLRTGEYVDIQNGKLMSILRKLPKVY